MAVNTQKYTIQNIDAVTGYDLEDGTLLFRAEDLHSGEMTNEQETVYATGKGGVRISASDRNKASRFTAENGTIVEGILAAQVGTDVETEKDAVIPDYYDVIAVTGEEGSATAVTTYTAVGETGAEIAFIYKKNADGTAGEKYPIAAAASETGFAYDPDTKTLSLPTKGLKAGDEIVAVYDFKVATAKHIQNREDKYSKTVRAVFDIFCQDICTNKSYLGKIIYPKGKVSGNFNLAFGDEFAVQNLEIEAMSGGCSGAANVLWDFYIYDDADAT